MDPRDLLLEELAQMLAVEETLAGDVLPALRSQVDEPHFQKAIDGHLEETRTHAERIEAVFGMLKAKPQRRASRALAGLQRQHSEGVEELAEGALRDLFCAGSAAHTEHFEIASYHGLIALANILGEPDVVRLLEQTLHEEEDALEKVEKAIPERLSGQLAPA